MTWMRGKIKVYVITSYWAEISCNNLLIKEEYVLTEKHTIDNIQTNKKSLHLASIS